MSVKGQIKEGAGFVKEEANEHGKSPESQRKAQEGRRADPLHVAPGIERDERGCRLRFFVRHW